MGLQLIADFCKKNKKIKESDNFIYTDEGVEKLFQHLISLIIKKIYPISGFIF